MGIGILHKYKDYISLEGAVPISMGEGDTPLVYSDYLSKETGASVYLKIEGCNRARLGKVYTKKQRNLLIFFHF